MPTKSTQLSVCCFLVLIAAENIPEWARFIPVDDYRKIVLRPLLTQNIVKSAAATVHPLLDWGLYQEDIAGCGLPKLPVCKVTSSTSSAFPMTRDGKAIIPYTVSPDLSDALQDLISVALGNMQDNVSCMVFRDSGFGIESPDEHAVLAFEPHTTCASLFAGLNTNFYQIFLADHCVSEPGSIHRLIMLAFGFPHEITRHDRDDHVQIFWDNVDPGRKDHLRKDTPQMTYQTPYDYDSVLHPGYLFLSKDQVSVTVTGKTAGDNAVHLGQQTGLSSSDITKLSRLFCGVASSRAISTADTAVQRTVKETVERRPSRNSILPTPNPTLRNAERAPVTSSDCLFDKSQQPKKQEHMEPFPNFSQDEMTSDDCSAVISDNCGDTSGMDRCKYTGYLTVQCKNSATANEIKTVISDLGVLEKQRILRVVLADNDDVLNNITLARVRRQMLYLETTFCKSPRTNVKLEYINMTFLLDYTLSHCRGQVIKRTDFRWNSYLQTIIFANTTISSLEPYTFTDLLDLKTLSLEWAAYKFMDESMLSHVKRLHCDCCYKWLRKWLRFHPSLTEAKYTLGGMTIYGAGRNLYTTFTTDALQKDFFYAADCTKEFQANVSWDTFRGLDYSVNVYC